MRFIPTRFVNEAWFKCGFHAVSKRLLETVSIVCFVLFAIGCTNTNEGEVQNSPAPQPEMEQRVLLPEQTEPAEPKEPILPFLFPLTGLGSLTLVNERPVMVMIENSPASRPHSGLEQADMVYEILAEGEITRFAAIFQSELVDVIGPVRSIRPYYVQIGEGLHAIIVHAGWSQEAINMLKSRKLNHLDQVYGDDAYFWRGTEKKAPHNLYTSTEKIRLGAEVKKFGKEWSGPVPLFAAKGDQLQGADATSVTIPYLHGYDVSYEYDGTTNTYKRFMEGEPHIDNGSGKQITAANIIIVEAVHRVLDNAGRRDVQLDGPGNGCLLRDGKKLDITWKRTNGIIQPYNDGKLVELTPGKTWIQVVPIGTILKAEDRNL